LNLVGTASLAVQCIGHELLKNCYGNGLS